MFDTGENSPTLDYRDPDWVAEQLGIDKNTVYKYLQEGNLPGSAARPQVAGL